MYKVEILSSADKTLRKINLKERIQNSLSLVTCHLSLIKLLVTN